MNIRSEIYNAIKESLVDKSVVVTDQTPLFGDESPLDSMGFADLCLQLQELAVKNGFTFNWSGDDASSDFHNLFKNVESLILSFESQMKSVS